MKKVGKAGNYDLAILDNLGKVSHVIEVKLLKNQGFRYNDTHRAYEDLYVLSDDLLGEDIKSSLFVVITYEEKREVEINKLLEKMEQTYRMAGVINFKACTILDKIYD